MLLKLNKIPTLEIQEKTQKTYGLEWRRQNLKIGTINLRSY